MAITAIEVNSKIVAKLIAAVEWKNGLNFFSDNSDYIQVGTWVYNKGKVLFPHIHNEVQRLVRRTHEVLFVYSGKIMASIFDLEGNLVTELEVKSGEILILLDCGHGYKILEDGTKVLELKNGPYLGPDIDRRRIADNG